MLHCVHEGARPPPQSTVFPVAVDSTPPERVGAGAAPLPGACEARSGLWGAPHVFPYTELPAPATTSASAVSPVGRACDARPARTATLLDNRPRRCRSLARGP